MDLFLKKLVDREMATRCESDFSLDAISRFTNPQYLLQQHELMLVEQQALKLTEQQSIGFNFSHITSHRPHGGRKHHVDIVDSNVVNIDDLISAVDQVLTGKFFLCRILAPWTKLIAIDTVVEDVKGKKAVRLAVYNAPIVLKTKLQVGSILAMKNPWFKRTKDMGFSLRVDNPDDIIYDVSILGKLNMEWKGNIPIKYQSLKPPQHSKEEWKQLGNTFFVKKKYNEARHHYNKGLLAFPGDIDLLSNRAATFLHLRRFFLALADVETVLSINENHSKAIYRKTKALCGLGKYLEALSFLSEKINTALSKKIKLDNFKQLKKFLKHVKNLVQQSKTGEFDIMELLDNYDSKYLDVAEYKGDVEVIPIEGKGRGLVANVNFSPGDLIMANRAIEMVFTGKMDDGVVGGLAINLVDNFAHEESHDRLVVKLVQLLNDEPEHVSKVYNLYAGQNFTVPSIETNVDVKRLSFVCSYNCFKRSDGTEGLWYLPSFINHSCVDYNARWRINGDFIFVRAMNSIAKGEEILIPYVQHLTDLKAKKIFFRSYSFRCNCTLCQAENEIGVGAVKKAEEILKKGFGHWTVKQVRKAIRELEKPTSNNKVLNMEHNALYVRLAYIYMKLDDLKSSLIVWKKLYDDLKDTPHVSVKVLVVANLCVLAEKRSFLPDFLLEWCEKELKQNLSILVGNSNVPKLMSVLSYVEIAKQSEKL